MADDGVGGIFVFFEELFGSGECYLIDIFLNVFGGHADTVVADGKCAGGFVDGHAHVHVAEFAFVFAER